ncbi:MAG: hypothetical protein SV966_01120 [Actinomycetota bacterium]|nr:hypothetical protein [Actinomycetota bacterium]
MSTTAGFGAADPIRAAVAEHRDGVLAFGVRHQVVGAALFLMADGGIP